MKKLFLIAAVAAALVSCSKSDNPEPKDQAEGIPMTLTADFGTDTKLSFNTSGSVIKSTWDASEAISVLTLDEEGVVVAIDNFTSEGTAGRKEASFTGTFTGGSSPARVIAIYPAIDISQKHTPDYTTASGTTSNVLRGVSVSSQYATNTDFSFLKQTANNNADHLKNYVIASGTVDITSIKSNNLKVSLAFHVPVMKIVAKFPDAYKGKILSSVRMVSLNSSGVIDYIFRIAGWNYIDIPKYGITCPGGGYREDVYLYTSFAVPSDGVATVYIPFIMPDNAFTTGRGLRFEAVAEGTTLTCKKTFTSDITFNSGAVYTVNATFE